MKTHSQTPGDPDLVDQLVTDIFSGRFKPGDFIPKEMEICKNSGLSRTAVRQRLARLADGGIIQRISGHGTRVREYSEWHILDPQVTDWMSRFAGPNIEILEEVLTFRLSIEPYVAMVAARCATAQDLVAMENAFNGMARNFQNAANNDRRLDSESDVAFHVAVYRATHNIVWSQLSHILRPSIQLVVTESNVSTNAPEESLRRHHKVMEAIRRRDEAAAFEAAQAVLAETYKALGLTPEQAEFQFLSQKYKEQPNARKWSG